MFITHRSKVQEIFNKDKWMIRAEEDVDAGMVRRFFCRLLCLFMSFAFYVIFLVRYGSCRFVVCFGFG